MRFSDVSKPNRARAKRWHKGVKNWSGGDWAAALCGEAGEAANVVKKLRRIECGIVADKDGSKRKLLLEELAFELADTYMYLDLVAWHYDVDLERAIKRKFNKVSSELGFPEVVR